MNDSKSIFTSVTFWGIVVGFLSQIAARRGWTIDAAGLTNDLAGLAGVLMALYGRLRASVPVHIMSQK